MKDRVDKSMGIVTLIAEALKAGWDYDFSADFLLWYEAWDTGYETWELGTAGESKQADQQNKKSRLTFQAAWVPRHYLNQEWTI